MGTLASWKLQITCLLLFLALIPLTIFIIAHSRYSHSKNDSALSLLASNNIDESILAIQPSPIKTVFVILMENANWATIKQASSAAYITQSMLPHASYANEYYNPPGVHPSEGNYVWMEAGSNFGIHTDNPPRDNHISTTKHLTTLLSSNGVSWKSYQEGIDGTSCPIDDNGLYTPRHNPMLYFDDVTDNLNTVSVNCMLHVRPFEEFSSDLAKNSIPQYNFITPNLCHDMHNSDNCDTPDQINNGDAWLSTVVPQILKSQAYKDGGALFLTWDEGAEMGNGKDSDGPIGMVVMSPYAKGGGYSNTIHYTHSSFLRTLQEIFNIQPFLGDAANATDLSDLFISLSSTPVKKVAMVNADAATKKPTATSSVTFKPTSSPTPAPTNTPTPIHVVRATVTSIPVTTTKVPIPTVMRKIVADAWAIYQNGENLSNAGFSFSYPDGWQVAYQSGHENGSLADETFSFHFYQARSLARNQNPVTDPSGVEKELLALEVFQPTNTIQDFIAKNFPQYKNRLKYTIYGKMGNKTMYQVSLPDTDRDAGNFGAHGIVLGQKHSYDIGFKNVMSKTVIDQIGTQIWPLFKFE